MFGPFVSTVTISFPYEPLTVAYDLFRYVSPPVTRYRNCPSRLRVHVNMMYASRSVVSKVVLHPPPERFKPPVARSVSHDRFLKRVATWRQQAGSTPGHLNMLGSRFSLIGVARMCTRTSGC